MQIICFWFDILLMQWIKNKCELNIQITDLYIIWAQNMRSEYED